MRRRKQSTGRHDAGELVARGCGARDTRRVRRTEESHGDWRGDSELGVLDCANSVGGSGQSDDRSIMLGFREKEGKE